MATVDKPELTEEIMQKHGFSSLQRKLRPTRFTAMSPKMAAWVDRILEFPIKLVEPSLRKEYIIATSDGFLLGRGGNEFLEDGKLLRKNWLRLLDAAELTLEERLQAEALYNKRIPGGPQLRQ